MGNESTDREKIGPFNRRTLELVAIFLMSLSLLQSTILNMTSSSYAVKRFQIELGQTGLYMKMMSNMTDICSTFGTVLGAFYTVLRKERSWDRDVSTGLSILNVIVFATICMSYVMGEEKGNVTFYYYALAVAAFTSGMTQSVVLAMLSKDLPYILFSIDLSVFLVMIYNLGFRYIYLYFLDEDLEYFIVINQIMMGMSLWVFTSIFWRIAFYDYKYEDQIDPFKGFGNAEAEGNVACIGESKVDEGKEKDKNPILEALSPTLMNIFGTIFVNFFYPHIVPYELLEYDAAFNTELVILVLSTTFSFIIAMLTYFGKGPNHCWKKKFRYYQGTWFLCIFYHAAMCLIFVILHKPESQISRFVKGNGIRVAILTIIVKCSEEFIRVVSLSGIGTQGNKGNGDLVTGVNGITKLLFTLTSFIGMGYLKVFRKYDRERETWPGNQLSSIGNLCYWVKESVEEGFVMLTESFTTDLRSYFEIEDPDNIIDG